MRRWTRRLVFGTPLYCGLRLHRADRGGGQEVRRHLDGAADALRAAYDMALDDDDAESLAARLAALPDLVRGFAYEGAGAALVVLDRFLPGPGGRFEALRRGPGATYAVLLHVGAGLAWSRLSPRRLEAEAARADPEMRWLPVDGYGFERGVFGGEDVIAGRWVPSLSPYGRRAFDQGLGRGLWFRTAANLPRIAERVAGFDPARRADLWSGVGLAAAYAGPNDEASLAALEEAAGVHLPSVRLGVACAAFMRCDGPNPSPNTERAARLVCGMPAQRAADEARRIQSELRAAGAVEGENPYEAFRVELQAAMERAAAAPAAASAAPRQGLSHRV
jgi:hypothetical protein